MAVTIEAFHGVPLCLCKCRLSTADGAHQTEVAESCWLATTVAVVHVGLLKGLGEAARCKGALDVHIQRVDDLRRILVEAAARGLEYQRVIVALDILVGVVHLADFSAQRKLERGQRIA